MRAVLTVAHGDRNQLKLDRDFPQPKAGDTDVVIKVAATAVNFHDIFTRRGMPGIRIPLPIIVGSDVAGEIVEVGSAVKGWRAGEHVLLDPLCLKPHRLGMIGEAFHGGRAEYALADESQLIRLLANVSPEKAATLPLAYATAHRMLTTRGRLAPGEKVLVLGASGGVGVACVQIAKLLGAEVIACAGSQEKVDRLKKLGADHVVNYQTDDMVTAMHKLIGKPKISGQGGVEVAVNFTGGDTFAATQRCVKRHGRILVCGATAGFNIDADARYLWTFEQEVIGSTGWHRNDIVALVDYVGAGKLDPVIDKILPLSEAAEAERLLEDREIFGKVLLKP